MNTLPKKLQQKLENRTGENNLRQLPSFSNKVDFSSNDYIGFARNKQIRNGTLEFLESVNSKNGATGSRLISGNHPLYAEFENMLCFFHRSEAALTFNSGYDANIGLFSSVPQKEDVVLYDALIHASIRDGISLGKAKAFKFKHLDLDDLHKKYVLLKKQGSITPDSEVYIVTESVYSMDGDSPELTELVAFCERNSCRLIIDEAHALGVYGPNGAGLVQQKQLENKIFARVFTFGKALGSHGAAVLGSATLIKFLVNYCRSFIYTTALPPHSIAQNIVSYNELSVKKHNSLLMENTSYFLNMVNKLGLVSRFVHSNSAIQSCIIPGVSNVKRIAKELGNAGFSVLPILSPTVPKNQERLRFCIHSFNSKTEIKEVLLTLNTLLK